MFHFPLEIFLWIINTGMNFYKCYAGTVTGVSDQQSMGSSSGGGTCVLEQNVLP